jgi:hypothetical protein
MIVLLAMAVISLVVVFRAPAAFEYEVGGGRWFNILVGAPTFLLCAITLRFRFEDYTVPVAAAAVGATVLLVAGKVALRQSVMARPGSFQVIALLMGAATGYGALGVLDVAYDAAPPATLSAPVLEKYETWGPRHGTDYYLRVGPFGPRKGAMSFRVSYPAYRAQNRGDEACILEHRGAVGVPWFEFCADIERPT